MVFRILENHGIMRNKKNTKAIYHSEEVYKALSLSLSTSGRRMSNPLKILVMGSVSSSNPVNLFNLYVPRLPASLGRTRGQVLLY